MIDGCVPSWCLEAKGVAFGLVRIEDTGGDGGTPSCGVACALSGSPEGIKGWVMLTISFDDTVCGFDMVFHTTVYT